MAGGDGTSESTPRSRDAGCPVEKGGVHIRIRPRRVEIDSTTNRRPLVSKKAIPEGVVNVDSEVCGFVTGAL